MKILSLKQQQQQQQKLFRQRKQQLFRQRLQLQRLGQAGANRASGHSGVTFFIRDCEDGIYPASENCSKYYFSDRITTSNKEYGKLFILEGIV